MQVDAHDDPVHLGFPVDLIPSELYRLKSHYLPVGKVGGRPAWLNPKTLPEASQLACKKCQKPMCFLAQVYANGPTDPEHAFHRTVYVFVCRDPNCNQTNDASNFLVLRCNLPRANDFYGFDGPVDADLEGDVADPRRPADAPKLCHVCGCSAKKRCAKCESVWYCARDHQVVDWPSHKLTCGKAADDTSKEATNPENSFLFKEYGLEIEREYVPATIFDGVSDDENDEDGEDSDDETEEDRQRRIKEFNQFVKENRGKNAELTKEELEAAAGEEKKDVTFDKFNRLIQLNPDQVIRYKRFGEPLKSTEAAPFPDVIPPCDKCGSPRRFELQLMPHLLSLIDVDSIENSIDWASVYVFTCSSSCRLPDDGYSVEFACKQDFS